MHRGRAQQHVISVLMLWEDLSVLQHNATRRLLAILLPSAWRPFHDGMKKTKIKTVSTRIRDLD